LSYGKCIGTFVGMLGESDPREHFESGRASVTHTPAVAFEQKRHLDILACGERF